MREGYGEIDHQLRYCLNKIPEVLEQNLMLLNRIAGSSDEMASLINMLSKSFDEIESNHNNTINIKDEKIISLKQKIENSKTIDEKERKELISEIDKILQKLRII